MFIEIPEWIREKIRALSGKKNCVILGGASGSGAEYVKLYAAKKYRVAFMDMDKEAGRELKQSLEKEYGKNFFFFHGDAYCESDVDIFIKAVRMQHGRANSFFYNLWNWPYMGMAKQILADKAVVACIYKRPGQ